MKSAYDEGQMAVRHQASNRTLAFLTVAVLANGAIVHFFGPWAGPLRQALLLILLTAIVLGLQLGWAGADVSPRDAVGQRQADSRCLGGHHCGSRRGVARGTSRGCS